MKRNYYFETFLIIPGEPVPLSAPDVRVQALGATSLKVEWDKLDSEDSRGAITQYQVFYRKTGQQSQKRVANIPGTSTEYIITSTWLFFC